jgi:AraC-like DNA-binding protein
MMILEYLSLIFGSLFFCFSWLLLLKKSPIRQANIIFGSILMVLTTYNFLYLLWENAGTKLFIELLASYYVPFDFVLYALIAPGIYFHLRLILNKSFSFRSYKTWLHGIPALPALFFGIAYLTLPETERISQLMSNLITPGWYLNILNGIFCLQMIFYLILCLYTVQKKLSVSQTTPVKPAVFMDLKWLRNTYVLGLALVLLSTAFAVAGNGKYVSAIVDLIIINVFFFYMFLKLIWNMRLFYSEPLILKRSRKNIKTSMNKDCQQFSDELHHSVSTSKVFLTKGCSLEDVAKQIGVQPYYLSDFINTHLNNNFSGFINEYRIGEAKHLLTDKTKQILTIEAIGQACGFSNKSSFNTAFKKFTSLTPSQYKQLNTKQE